MKLNGSQEQNRQSPTQHTYIHTEKERERERGRGGGGVWDMMVKTRGRERI